MFLTDTHIHLYLEEFTPDRSEVILRAQQKGVEKFLMPNIDTTTLQAMISLWEQYPDHCRMMFGLHPCSVKENWEEELLNIQLRAKQYPFVGIGEIGLDYYWDTRFQNEQRKAFEKQIQWATEKNLPVSVHSRNALDECIEMVSSFPSLKGVFHCFTGNKEQAEKILTRTGFYLGIGGVVTFKNSGLAQVLADVPAERIVVETDAPYLAPVPFRGKRNEPGFLAEIVSFLKKIYSSSGIALEKILWENTRNVFGTI